MDSSFNFHLVDGLERAFLRQFASVVLPAYISLLQKATSIGECIILIFIISDAVRAEIIPTSRSAALKQSKIYQSS